MLAAVYQKYQADWRPLVRNVLSQSLWWAQEEIIDSVWRNRATAVRAGHGVGKTHAAAVAAVAFLYAFKPAKILITAPTWWQAKHVFWRAVRKIHAAATPSMGGKMHESKISLSDDWWAQARATENANFFQGVHAPNLLVVVDEAAGVSESIFEGVRTLGTGGTNKLLLIGNPTARSGSFYAAFSDPAYQHIHISCFEHPNVVERKESIRGAVTREWIDERRAEWEGTPLWEARVLGEFPAQSDDQLISLAWITAAEAREATLEGPAAVGVDVARFGGDETAIYVMRSGAVIARRILRGRDLMETAGHVNALAQEHGVSKIAVDDTGLGGGLTDRLRELGHDVIPINFAASPADARKYHDVPSELWGELAEGMKAGLVGPIPRNDALGAQLASRRYTYRNCRLKVESKEEMKSRGLKSPDRADALALAWRAWREAAGLYHAPAGGTLLCLGDLLPH